MQQQLHGVFDAHVTHEDRGFHVRAQVLVEDEVQTGNLGKHFENGFQVGVAKFQGHRFVEAGAQLRIRNHVAALHQANVALQFQRAFVVRVQFEDLPHLAFGPVDVAPAQVATGQFEFFIEAAHVFQLTHGVLGAAVVRLDGQHPSVTHARRSEIALGAVHLGLGQQRGDSAGTGGVEGNVQLGVARVFAQPFLDPGQAGFILTLFDQVRGFFLGDLRRAACGQPCTKAQAHQQTGLVHCALPTDKVWDKCRGK
ncbi:hypothetical protein D3C81_268910 [compost metagenome]